MKTTCFHGALQGVTAACLLLFPCAFGAAPQILTVDVNPTPLRSGGAYTVELTSSANAVGGYVMADLRPTSPQIFRLNLQAAGNGPNGSLAWTAAGTIPVGLQPAPGASATFRIFLLDARGASGRSTQTVPWRACDEFGTYGPAPWPLASKRCRSDHVLEVGRSLENVVRIDVLFLGVFDGPGGTRYATDCPPGYSYCLENRNDGKSNAIRLGVVECDDFGTYGPAPWEHALKRCRSDHVLEVGRSLENVVRIDVLFLDVFDGPGGTQVTASCPPEYSYCLENRNDGTGNAVILGVVEKQDCVLGDWVVASECDPHTGKQPWIREVVTPAMNGGAECGPTEEMRDCPVDCQGSWYPVYEFTECRNGVEVTGIYSEFYVVHPALNGGTPCPNTPRYDEVIGGPCVDCDAFGWYGPSGGANALGRCRSEHVLEVGRSLENVVRIDVLFLGVYDGPGGTRLAAGCPSEYSYCLENRNDGTGNAVILGVVEKQDCVLGDWVATGSCDPDTGKQLWIREVVTPAKNGGTPCEATEEWRDCPVDCEGSWVILTDEEWTPCHEGIEILVRTSQYRVTRPARNGGTDCPFPDGEVRWMEPLASRQCE